jgi:O-antigen ligase
MKHILLVSILLFFLSGQFELTRVTDLLSIEVRYVFLLLIALLIPIIYSASTRVYINRKLYNAYFIACIIFIYLLGLTVFYSPNIYVASEKFIDTIILIIILTVLFFTLRLYKSSAELINVVTIFFAVVGIIYCIPILYSTIIEGNRGSIIIGGPNVATRILYFSFTSYLYLWYYYKKNWLFFMSLINFISIIFLGSRGGLVGAGLTIILVAALAVVLNYKRLNQVFSFKLFISILIFLGFIYYFLYDFINNAIYTRIVTQLIDNVHYAGRDNIYQNALELIKESPIYGHGLNAYGVFYNWHPHNMFLEITLDAGVIGLFFMILLILYGSVATLYSMKKHYFIISTLPIYMLVVSQFSGEFYDFRYYFLWTFILFYCISTDKIQETKKRSFQVKYGN